MAEGSDIKISVIVPAYNAARFLPHSLPSAFAQTHKPEEVIVVDDGSTDNTAEVAAKLGAKVIRRENGGISAARNTGIQNAVGDWIALLDADDRWAPKKLELQVACIRSTTVLVYTGNRFLSDNGSRDVSPAIDPLLISNVLRYRNPIAQSTILVRRETLMRDGGYREEVRACEDWEMMVRLQRLGTFEAVEAPLMDCYLHSDSLSADPEVMLRGFEQILDTTLVADLQGWDRWAWKQRIRAVQLRSAGLIARDNALKGELRYLFRSMCAWPFPLWQPQRFTMFAVSAQRRLFYFIRNGCFRP